MSVQNYLAEEMELLEAGKPCGWFWETDSLAVVMGRSGKSSDEVYENRCYEDNVEVISRRSGGGTVIVGAGVLCFGVVLEKEWQKINPNALAQKVLLPVSEGLSVDGVEISIEGLGDLSCEGKKICGTAQRWLKKSILLHGTILVDFDITLLEKYLKHPPKEPEYRRSRKHSDFCVNLSSLYKSSFYIRDISSLIKKSVVKNLDIQMEWLGNK